MGADEHDVVDAEMPLDAGGSEGGLEANEGAGLSLSLSGDEAVRLRLTPMDVAGVHLRPGDAALFGYIPAPLPAFPDLGYYAVPPLYLYE
jgi:hypothetical protein